MLAATSAPASIEVEYGLDGESAGQSVEGVD